MGNTTHMRGNAAGSLVQTVYGKSGGSTLPAKLIYANASKTLVYSTPTATLSGGGASSASGASSSGTPTVTATATPGGNHSGSLTYQWIGGVTLAYVSSNTSVLTGYYNFSGVANGSTSSVGPDTAIYCVITDTVTGAQYTAGPITMGPLSWTNTIPAYGPFTAGSSGGFSSSSGGAGSGAHTIRDIADVPATVSVVSGGPVSGSYSYNWFVEISSSGATLSNTSSATCNVHFDWNIPPATSSTNTITLGVTMTDLVSGYSSTAHGIAVSRSFTNDSG